MISSGSLKYHRHMFVQLFLHPCTYTHNNNDTVFKRRIKSSRVYLRLQLKRTHPVMAGGTEAPCHMASTVRSEREMNVDT